jgi:DHA2 family multidrug resistance protein
MPPVSLTHRLSVAAVLLGVFAAVLNARVSGFAAVDLQGELGYGPDETAWVNCAYAVGEVLIIPWAVWLATVVSVRRVIVPASIFFAAATLLCARAGSLEALVGARFLQGLTGGALIPMATPVFRRKLPLHPRVMAFALYGMAATLPFALGPAINGLLTEWGTWRAVFYPVAALSALVALLASACMVPVPVDWEKARKVDVFGLASASVGCACLVLGADQGYRLGWLSSLWVAGFLAAGVLLLAAAWVHSGTYPTPAFTLDILTRLNLHVALATFLVVRFSLLLVGWLLPDLLVRLQGLRPIDFALAFGAMALPQVLVPLIVVRGARNDSDPRLLFAAAITCQAIAFLRAMAVTGGWQLGELIPVLLLHGVGQGLLFVPLLLLLTQNLDDVHRPTAMTLTNLTRAVGNALGASFLGTLLGKSEEFHSERLGEHVIGQPLVDRLAALSLRGVDGARALGVVARQVRREAFVLAYGDVFLLVGSLLLGCVLLHLLLRPVDLSELDAPSFPPAVPLESS